MDVHAMEQIVREVVRRLEGLAQPADGAADRPGVLHVEGPVVSLASLQSQLDANGKTGRIDVVHPTALHKGLEGIDRVLVAARAVVTPAVRDLLRERGVALVLRADGAGDHVAMPAAALLVGIDRETAGQARQWDMLERTLPIERTGGRDLVRLVDGVGTAVRRDRRLALLLTERTAAALCLANRLPAVRAVLAADLLTAREAVDAVGANLLICSPRRTAAGERLRMVEDFYRRGVVPCPDTLRERLG